MGLPAKKISSFNMSKWFWTLGSRLGTKDVHPTGSIPSKPLEKSITSPLHTKTRKQVLESLDRVLGLLELAL